MHRHAAEATEQAHPHAIPRRLASVGNIPNRGPAERQGPVLRRRGPLSRQLADADAVEDLPRGRHIPGLSLRGDAVLSLQGWAVRVPTRTWAPLPRPDLARARPRPGSASACSSEAAHAGRVTSDASGRWVDLDASVLSMSAGHGRCNAMRADEPR